MPLRPPPTCSHAQQRAQQHHDLFEDRHEVSLFRSHRSHLNRIELPMLTSARWSTSRARTSRPARTLKPLGFRFGRLQASYASLLVCLLSYCPLNVSKAPSCGSHASHAEARSSLDRVFSRIICREDVQTARVGLQASHACGLRYSRTHGVEPMAASEGDG